MHALDTTFVEEGCWNTCKGHSLYVTASDPAQCWICTSFLLSRHMGAHAYMWGSVPSPPNLVHAQAPTHTRKCGDPYLKHASPTHYEQVPSRVTDMPTYA